MAAKKPFNETTPTSTDNIENKTANERHLQLEAAQVGLAMSDDRRRSRRAAAKR